MAGVRLTGNAVWRGHHSLRELYRLDRANGCGCADRCGTYAPAHRVVGVVLGLLVPHADDSHAPLDGLGAGCGAGRWDRDDSAAPLRPACARAILKLHLPAASCRQAGAWRAAV